MGDEREQPRGLSRRALIARGGAAGAALSLAGLMAACGDEDNGTSSSVASSAAEPATSAPAATEAPATSAAAETTAAATEAATTAPETTAAETTAAADAPVQGGTLRVAVVGGAASDEQLDPHQNTVNSLDVSRIENVYEKLTDMSPEGEFVPQLAESLESNAAGDQWVVKLKSGVVFHDGSPLTADDVIYSYSRLLDPANELPGAGALDMIDPKGLRKIDDLTVEINLNRPWVDLPSQVGQRFCSIIKKDTTTFAADNLNGTGPFKLSEWTPGEKTVLVRHDNYRESGKPYVDTVEIVGINDLTARLNALQAGQVDAIEQVDPSQVPVIEGNSDLALFLAPGGGWTPIKMDCKAKPYDDVRVRQAFKHLADRQKMVDAALQGYGDIGNDIFGVADPLYARDIPQREFDPERAKSLLAEAGVADQTFELHTSDVVPSMASSALVFQQTAKAAGIDIKVTKHPADGFWSEVYGKTPLGYTDWGYRPLLAQWNLCFNTYPKEETNWDNPRAAELFNQATATVDEALRKEMTAEMQQLLWDDGGYVIYGFGQRLDGLSSKVQGLQPHIFFALGWYQFKDAWLV